MLILLQKINYLWRLLATGICFSFFGIGGVFLGMIVFPLLFLVERNLEQRERRSRRVIQKTWQLFLGMMRFLGVMESRCENVEALNESEGMLVIANHPSLIDVIFLVGLTDNVNCIVKEAAWKNPCMRGPVTAARYLNNGDSISLVDNCVAALKREEALLIFPEGTRTVPGKPRKFQRGVANVAVRSGALIRPVHISIEPSTLTKRDKWYHIPPKKFVVTLKVKEPIDVAQLIQDSGNNTVAARRITDYLEQYYDRLDKGEESV